MASYHEMSTPHQVGMETPDLFTQYSTSQPLSIATTEAVRARMGLISLDHTYSSSGQTYDTESRHYTPTAFRSCHFCGQMFQERELARHLETHQPKEHRKRYSCSECPKKSFARQDGLLKHQSNFHGRERKSSSRR
ncbi:uncharacterized protein FFB20_11748 [Fusarium fujikuroi]|uniref:Uncharacterized protein n=1 Tax=Fusarium fujikuroi TaxID=5127 RepID=A0A2H3RGR8_FUSFU|nr:uncharacterized protein FFC1_03660 [Fusarium fujikuroi]SCO02876.1 uncharacterized protein FFB20_11748 [Fusarium fujikuroi]SCO03081.1 uncharacterized protein FFE2_10188 [Fusarium fujikuroi]SCO44166.1 uncharacterized protein FFMR_07381 [Fusarium fujikuroi]SCO54886.1 uncharacterized protein FFNC_15682 [Fusarium fujikuroi]